MVGQYSVISFSYVLNVARDSSDGGFSNCPEYRLKYHNIWNDTTSVSVRYLRGLEL